MRVLQIRHDHCGDGEHEAAQNLLGVVVDPRVGKADTRTVQGYPGTPLELEHETAHAEYHGEDVHVVRSWVVSRSARCGCLVPVNFIRSTRIVDVVAGMHTECVPRDSRSCSKCRANLLQLMKVESYEDR